MTVWLLIFLGCLMVPDHTIPFPTRAMCLEVSEKLDEHTICWSESEPWPEPWCSDTSGDYGP